MPTHKIGPWSSDDWQEFIALDVSLLAPESERNKLSGLLGLGGLNHFREHERRVERLAVAWRVREAHPVYKAITIDPNFRAAWKVFEQRRKMASGSKLAADNGALLFLKEFVEHAGFAYQLRDGPDVTRGADAKGRRAAAKHADALTALLSSGVRMKDYVDTHRLRELLAKLGDEMRSTRRKDYGGKRYMTRWVLKAFALSLMIHFELRSPSILCHFARMVGVACETKTAQRYCNEAAKDWRRRQIAAELGAQQSGTTAPGQNSSSF